VFIYSHVWPKLFRKETRHPKYASPQSFQSSTAAAQRLHSVSLDRHAYLQCCKVLRIMNLPFIHSKSDVQQIYVRKPGPTTYYSHFSSLYLSACLAFQSLQVFRRMSFRNPPVNKWHGFFANGYLIILTLCGLIDGIAFSFTPKPDTTAISFLSFFDGIAALIDKFRIKNIQSVDTSASLLPESSNGIVKSKPRFRRWGYAALRVSNRVLMSLHVLLIVLSVAGAIELALTYRYTNPYDFFP
jgi:hypothetical protein